jgi:hypothetical protein
MRIGMAETELVRPYALPVAKRSAYACRAT